MTVKRDRSARLEPMDYTPEVRRRSKDSTTCPCCGEPTTFGWVDDLGCCYGCERWFLREDEIAFLTGESPLSAMMAEGKFPVMFR